jgi:hypothetical protein
MNREINKDGSIKGKTFSGVDYKGEYPHPKVGKETYKQFYERVRALNKTGYHLGDLSWSDYHDYCYGSPGGGGQYISHCIIGRASESSWTEEEEYEEDC